MIETHEHAGEFKGVVSATLRPKSLLVNTVRFILLSDKDEDACRQRHRDQTESTHGLLKASSVLRRIVLQGAE